MTRGAAPFAAARSSKGQRQATGEDIHGAEGGFAAAPRK